MMDTDLRRRLERCDRASTYHYMSWEYLEFYQAAASQHPDDFGGSASLTSPKLFNLCHALELAMKGWLILKEGMPESIASGQRRTLRQAGIDIPKTLKDYSHHLAHLAADAGQYYPPLLAQMQIWEHLTKSYWGDDSDAERRRTRDYEYPEGKKVVSYVAPSELALLVMDCTEALGWTPRNWTSP